MRARQLAGTFGAVAIGLAALLPVHSLHAAPEKAPETTAEEDVDHVALAALLIRDGHWDRASIVLRELEPADVPEVDLGRYFMLRGLVQLEEDDPAGAADDLQSALDHGWDDPLLHLHLARAQLETGDATAALTAIDAAGEAGEAVAGAWLLRSRALWTAGRTVDAYEVLVQGEARFPDEVAFTERRVMRLIESGLFQEAQEVGRIYLSRGEPDADGWIAIAEAMRRAHEPLEAATLLEEARLRFPGALDVLAALAASWLDAERPLAAAMVLQEAAELDPELASEAAECFRQGGRLDRALYMNSLVPDATEKARQRLGLLIESERWERALALEGRLSRLGLLDDDNVAYALAYASFKVGDFAGAETWIRFVDDPRVFAHATALREAMEQCADNPWGC